MTKKSIPGLCSINDCEYVGRLIRKMCRKHYAQWQKLNTKVSWLTSVGMVCSRCREDKVLSEFARDSGSKSGYRARCKACCVQDQRDWRDRDPEAARERMQRYAKTRAPQVYNSAYRRNRYVIADRNSALIKQYGITESQYVDLFESQGSMCAICGGQDSRTAGRIMHLDHDHNTGKNRGILCASCNKGLGMFYDDPDRLESAALYLRDHASREVSASG